jgi:SPP1 gp7 family putative phage head morphogenesis protein
MVQTMVLAHLRGTVSARASAGVKPTRTAQASVLSDSVDFLRRRLKLTKRELEEIERVYGAHVRRVLSGVGTAVERKLRAAVLAATEQGMTTREAVRHLAAALDAAGVTSAAPHTVEAIFRTNAQMAYSAARYKADQDPAVQQILWGYTYVTTGDDRVRDTHYLLDGVTLPKDDPRWSRIWPPNGWNCRCQVISLFEPEPVNEPRAERIDGKLVQPGPDTGFAFNPGQVFA